LIIIEYFLLFHLFLNKKSTIFSLILCHTLSIILLWHQYWFLTHSLLVIGALSSCQKCSIVLLSKLRTSPKKIHNSSFYVFHLRGIVCHNFFDETLNTNQIFESDFIVIFDCKIIKKKAQRFIIPKTYQKLSSFYLQSVGRTQSSYNLQSDHMWRAPQTHVSLSHLCSCEPECSF
jgi:hypothetical protein